MSADAARPSSPYKGLSAFDDSDLDALFFFGREREREVIVANAVATRLTVLYGDSGVGKSSILRAGVLRRLRELEPEAHVALFDTWSDDVSATLADARRAESAYVILDQFEEYFLYHGDASGPGTLLYELPELMHENPRVNVLSSRARGLARPARRVQSGIPAVFANQLRLEHLDREAARAAILGPVARWNDSPANRSRWSPHLVDAVLDEVAGVAGRGGRVEAPYLQLVLERLWGRGARCRFAVVAAFDAASARRRGDDRPRAPGARARRARRRREGCRRQHVRPSRDAVGNEGRASCQRPRGIRVGAGGVAAARAHDAEPRADPPHRRRNRPLRDLSRRSGGTGACMAGAARLERERRDRTGGSGAARLRGCLRRLRLPLSLRSRSSRSFRGARPRTLAGAPCTAQASSRRPRLRISRATRFGACNSRSRPLASSARLGWRTSRVRRCSRRTFVSCFRRAAPSRQLPPARTHDLPRRLRGRPGGVVRPKDLRKRLLHASCPRPRHGRLFQPDRPPDSRRGEDEPRAGIPATTRPSSRSGIAVFATRRSVRAVTEIVTGGDAPERARLASRRHPRLDAPTPGPREPGRAHEHARGRGVGGGRRRRTRRSARLP